MLTENMKIWLKRLYLEAAEEHLVAASNERIWSLGSDTHEAAALHEANVNEHIALAEILKLMANNIKEN